MSNFNLQLQSTLQNSSQSKEVNDWVDLKWVPVVNNLDFRSENLSCLNFATDDSDLLSKLWIVDISNAHLGFLTAALNPKCTSLVKNTSRRVNNLQYGSAVFNWSDGGKTGAYGEYSPILFRPHRNTWWKGIKWTLSKTISKVESWKRPIFLWTGENGCFSKWWREKHHSVAFISVFGHLVRTEKGRGREGRVTNCIHRYFSKVLFLGVDSSLLRSLCLLVTQRALWERTRVAW